MFQHTDKGYSPRRGKGDSGRRGACADCGDDMSGRGRCRSLCGGGVRSLAVDVLGLGEEEVLVRETGLRWKAVLMSERSALCISGGGSWEPGESSSSALYIRP